MQKLRQQFEEMMMVIVDEMSLVGADFFYTVHRRLVEILQIEDMFADRGVMLVGDLLQIPPVQAAPIFLKPTTDQNESLWNSDANLWNSCDCVELIVNKRQGISKWTDTLNRIRIGEQNDEDVALLETRRMSKFEKNFDEALHVFYRNVDVNAHNIRLLNDLDGDLYTFPAIIKGLPRGMLPKIKDGFVEKSRFLEYLQLKKGALVALVHNIDISDCLVNGVTGKVIDFVYRIRPSETQRNIVAIVVQFDDPKIGQDLRRVHKNLHKAIELRNGVPIFTQFNSFSRTKFKKGQGRSNQCTVEQFPLTLNYASTSHKIQGRTLSNQDIVCHGREGNYKLPAGCGYVMLSRCTKLDNVYIDQNFNLKEDCLPHLQSLEEAKKIAKNCIAAQLKTETFDIFYVNMRAKSHLIDVANDPFAKQSGLVCLVQTGFSDNDVIQWPFVKRQSDEELKHDVKKRCMPHASKGFGKGVCCFTNPDVIHQNLFRTKLTTEDYQIVKMTMNNRVQIFVIYITPTPNFIILENISKSINDLIMPDLDIIILGDFNFHANRKTPLSQYLKSTLGLVQMIEKPTFIYGSNTLDHIYVTPTMKQNIIVNYRFNYYTDHMSFNISLNY